MELNSYDLSIFESRVEQNEHHKVGVDFGLPDEIYFLSAAVVLDPIFSHCMPPVFYHLILINLLLGEL